MRNGTCNQEGMGAKYLHRPPSVVQFLLAGCGSSHDGKKDGKG
jgi:hypothetical protein